MRIPTDVSTCTLLSVAHFWKSVMIQELGKLTLTALSTWSARKNKAAAWWYCPFESRWKAFFIATRRLLSLLKSRLKNASILASWTDLYKKCKKSRGTIFKMLQYRSIHFMFEMNITSAWRNKNNLHVINKMFKHKNVLFYI